MNMIDFMKFTDRAREKYECKVEADKAEKVALLELDTIAKWVAEGRPQEWIGCNLKNKVSRQTVSKRIALIKQNYPHLLGEESVKSDVNSVNIELPVKSDVNSVNKSVDT